MHNCSLSLAWAVGLDCCVCLIEYMEEEERDVKGVLQSEERDDVQPADTQAGLVNIYVD